MTIVDFEPFVAELANVAGEAILPFFRTALHAQDKGGLPAAAGGFDPVTEADRAAETAMRRLIQSTFPAHGIVGEEFGDHQADAEYVWVLDPIDGTKSFISGLPTWGTLVALEHGGVPVYGMMHQPFTREKFFGDNARATWSGRNSHNTEIVHQLRTRACAALAERHRDDDEPRADGRGRARFLRARRRGGQARALRRGLLQLLHGGGRPRRPRDRVRPRSPTTSRP